MPLISSIKLYIVIIVDCLHGVKRKIEKNSKRFEKILMDERKYWGIIGLWHKKKLQKNRITCRKS